MSLTTEARLHSTCQTCQSHLKTDFQHMCTNACGHLPSPLPTHLHRAKKGKEGREEKYFGKVLGPFLLLSKSASSGRFEKLGTSNILWSIHFSVIPFQEYNKLLL